MSALDDYLAGRFGRGGRASLDDLWACYRLLLGRQPDEAGFEAYAATIARGVDVDELVRMFVASPEFLRRQMAPFNPEIAKARLDGFDLYVPAADAVVGEEILARGTYEPHVTEAIKAALKPGMSFVDVGANVGYFTLLAAKAVGETGQVFAFEPLARNVRLLAANALLNEAKNVTILPFAVGAAEGLVSLMAIGSIAASRDATLDDLLAANALEFAYVKALDDWALAGLKVDVLKIDIDGYDHQALLGARGLLQRDHPMVFAEFLPSGLAEHSKVEPIAYLELYRDLGYSRFEILNRDAGPTDFGSDIAAVAAFPQAHGMTHVDLRIS